jgi:hypothetical protein
MVIVNETFARKMWGDTPAIGQLYFPGSLEGSVGVAEAASPRDEDSPQPVYLPRRKRAVVQDFRRWVVPGAEQMAAVLERILGSPAPSAPVTRAIQK